MSNIITRTLSIYLISASVILLLIFWFPCIWIGSSAHRCACNLVNKLTLVMKQGTIKDEPTRFILCFSLSQSKTYGTYLATQLALFCLQLPTMLVAVDRAFESAWKYSKQIIKQKWTIGLLQSRHEFYYVNWWAAFDRIEQTDPEFTSQPPCIGRVGYRETNGASCIWWCQEYYID